MGAITYATLDPNQITAAGDLELSSLQLVNVATGLAQSRSTIALSTGRFYVEFLYHGDVDEALTSNCRVGIGGALASVSTVIGTTSDSYAYRLDTGAVYSNNAVVTTLTPAAKGDTVALAIDLDASPPSMEVLVNGASIGVVAIAGGTSYRVYVALSATAFASTRAFVNFGQRGTEFPAPTGYRDGWFTEASDPPLLRIASSSVTFAADDPDAPNAHFSGRLEQQFRFPTRREIAVWPNGRSGGSRVTLASIPLIDPDGAFAALLTSDYRDQPVRILSLEEGEPYASAEVVAVGVVDRVESDGARTTLTLKDKLATLDTAFQRRLFPPNAAESAANRPRPTLLGTARNFEPVLYDEANRAYAVNDRAVRTIVVVRDRGDPLQPDGSPQDWVYNDTSTGFLLTNEPQGKLTVDASTTGGAGPPVFIDVLDGIGDPFTGGSDVNGFDEGEGTFSGEPYGAEVVSGRLRLFHGDSGPSTAVAWVRPAGSPAPVSAGATYRARIVVPEFTFHGGNRGCTLFVRGSSTGNTYATITAPGAYAFTFTADTNEIYVAATQAVAGGDSAERAVFVDSFTLEEVAVTVVTNYDAPIPGISLADFASEVIEGRAGLSSSDWSEQSAIDIDDGYDCGIYTAEQITCRQALDRIIDSYTAGWWQSRTGVIRFGRLEDPELVTSPDTLTFAFDETDIIGRPRVYMDLAPGLSTSIACRRNWSPYGPSDFVDDIIDVPLALRERFKRNFQFTRVSSANLAPAYRHALIAAPIETLIDDPDDAQREIDRVCALFTQLRYFVEWTVHVTDANEFAAEPFDKGTVAFPDIPLLAAGRRVQLRAVDFDGTTVKFLGWF